MSEVNSVILEIRAGVGGEEAALFAAELLRMYQRYAQKRGWQSTLLDISYSSLGGVKEAVLEITGDGVEILKNEGGVHRVQRIPATEKSGRVHTSTASVAVMSRPKEAKIDIKPEDLEITFFVPLAPAVKMLIR